VPRIVVVALGVVDVATDDSNVLGLSVVVVSAKVEVKVLCSVVPARVGTVVLCAVVVLSVVALATVVSAKVEVKVLCSVVTCTVGTVVLCAVVVLSAAVDSASVVVAEDD